MNTFKNARTFRWVICFLLLHLSHSSVQIFGKICHGSIHTSYPHGTLLNGGFLGSHSSWHAGRYSSLLSCCNKPCYGFFSGPGVQGSATAEFNSLAAHRCVLHWQEFSSVINQAVARATEASMTRVWTILEGMGQLIYSRGYTKQCFFLVHLFRVALTWHTIGIYPCAFFNLWNLFITARL